MPELPEVETTLRGIAPALKGHRITHLEVRNPRLRWVVPVDLPGKVEGQRVTGLQRRAKYILISLEHGSLIWHLGMSGSMRLVEVGTASQKHDHIDLQLDSGRMLRYNDPRRFGCLLWGGKDALAHPLLNGLGPEPLHDVFDAGYLYRRSRGRRLTVKQFIMDQKTVVGVGNIYASEALFLAGILPTRQAARISLSRYQSLVIHIKAVLIAAIAQGGTSLRDFTQADGRPGYFEQRLNVYGRAGEACVTCGAQLQNKMIGQRASYYCAVCQR